MQLYSNAGPLGKSSVVQSWHKAYYYRSLVVKTHRKRFVSSGGGGSSSAAAAVVEGWNEVEPWKWKCGGRAASAGLKRQLIACIGIASLRP